MNDSDARLKAVVTGAMGRMGRLFVQYLLENDGCALYGTTERQDHPMIGKDVGFAMSGRPVDVSLENDLRNCIVGANVVIDFTAPEPTLSNVKVCAEKGIPYVCGTTGMKPEQLAIFNEYAAKTRTIFAPNFSVGVTLLLLLAERAARALGDEFDVEIVETHHRHKADAPSGTALALARAVAEGTGVDDAAFDYGRKGVVGERESGRIGIHAVRGGDVVGDHEILFLGDGEQVALRHRATSRGAFVRGAIRAALWLQDKEPGIYSMKDIIGSRW